MSLLTEAPAPVTAAKASAESHTDAAAKPAAATADNDSSDASDTAGIVDTAAGRADRADRADRATPNARPDRPRRTAARTSAAPQTPPPPNARPPHPPSPSELGLRRILMVVDVLLGFSDENELLPRLLPALLRSIPADSVLWLAGDKEHSVLLAEPAAAATADLQSALDAHADADPLLVRVRRGAGTAIRRSDVQTDLEFQRLAAFHAGYEALGARHQLALSVRPSADRRVLILFNRCGADFSHLDLAVAESLRPRIGRTLSRFGPPGVRREQVSPREADVLDLLCRGLTDRQIATRLGISPRTVDKHLEHAYVKLGVRCRVQAATRWQA